MNTTEIKLYLAKTALMRVEGQANKNESSPEDPQTTHAHLVASFEKTIGCLINGKTLSKKQWEFLHHFLSYLNIFITDRDQEDIEALKSIASILGNSPETSLVNILTYQTAALSIAQSYIEIFSKQKTIHKSNLTYLLNNLTYLFSSTNCLTDRKSDVDTLVDLLFTLEPAYFPFSFIAAYMYQMSQKNPDVTLNIVNRLRSYVLSHDVDFPHMLALIKESANLRKVLMNAQLSPNTFFEKLTFDYLQKMAPSLPVWLGLKYSSAWRQVDAGTLEQNFTHLLMLHAWHDDSLEHLYRTFGIIHLGRYPLYILKRQYNLTQQNHPTKLNKTVVITVTAVPDWNGAFRKAELQIEGKRTRKRVSDIRRASALAPEYFSKEQADHEIEGIINFAPKKTLILYFEGNHIGVLRKIHKLLNNSSSAIESLSIVVKGHGSPKEIILSNGAHGSITDSLLHTSKEIPAIESLLDQTRCALSKRSSKIILLSCSTGSDNTKDGNPVTPIGQILSNTLCVEVIAPNDDSPGDVEWTPQGLTANYRNANTITFKPT